MNMTKDTDPVKHYAYFKALLNVDTPFRWDVDILDENLYEADWENVDDEFSFLRFVSHLVKICVEYNKENFQEALKLIIKLQQSTDVLIENAKPGLLLMSINTALTQVIHISKATILLHSNEIAKCYDILEAMPPLSDPKENEEAAILAIRSACYSLYSYKGTESSLDFIDRAIRKDPKTVFWRFLKASYLYKLRVVLNPFDPPSLEERELLENVNEEDENNPLFMVYLADVYRESAYANENRKDIHFWFVPQESRNTLTGEIETMYKNSKMLYEKAYELRPNCPLIAFRVSNGLMKIPQKHQNMKLVKQIIIDLLPKNKTSGFGNSVSAYYYYKFGKNPNLAKVYLKVAMELKVFNAYINFIKLSYLENKQYNAVEELERMLTIFQEAPKRKIIFSQIISYYLFIKWNLQLACENVIRYLKEEGLKNSLERHYSCFVNTNKSSINLIDVVADDVKLAIGDRFLAPDQRKFYDSFVHFMGFYNICVWKGKPQNLRKQILEGKMCAAASGSQQNHTNVNKLHPLSTKRKNFNLNIEGVPKAQIARPTRNWKERNPISSLPDTRLMRKQTDGCEIKSAPMQYGRQKGPPHQQLNDFKPNGTERETRNFAPKEHNGRTNRQYRESHALKSPSLDRTKKHREYRRHKESSYYDSDDEYHSRHRRSSRNRESRQRKHSYTSSCSDYDDQHSRGRNRHHRHTKYSSVSDISSEDSHHKRYRSPSRRRYRRRSTDDERSHKRSNKYRHARSYSKSSSSSGSVSDYENSTYKKKSGRKIKERSTNHDERSRKQRKEEAKLTKKFNAIKLSDDNPSQSSDIDDLKKQKHDPIKNEKKLNTDKIHVRDKKSEKCKDGSPVKSYSKNRSEKSQHDMKRIDMKKTKLDRPEEGNLDSGNRHSKYVDRRDRAVRH